jgi:hypothetical protein
MLEVVTRGPVLAALLQVLGPVLPSGNAGKVLRVVVLAVVVPMVDVVSLRDRSVVELPNVLVEKPAAP